MTTKVQNFLLNLLEEAGMDVVPNELRDKMLADLAKRLDAKLTLTVLSALPKDKIGEFEDLISDNKSALELSDYLSQNIADINEIYAQALVEFKKSYLSKEESLFLVSSK